MAKENINDRVQQEKLRVDLICKSMRRQIIVLGFDEEQAATVDSEAMQYELSADPYTGSNTLVGTWKGDRGEKKGSILFHADGSFYAEYDIVKQHPTDKRMFVSGVTAWGRNHDVKTEPALLPMPD
jgi:hypothetical protein